MKKSIIAALIASSLITTTAIAAEELIQFKSGEAAVAADVNANFNYVSALASLAQSKASTATATGEKNELSITGNTTAIATNTTAIMAAVSVSGGQSNDIDTLNATQLSQQQAIDLLIALTKPFVLVDALGTRVGEVITLGTHQKYLPKGGGIDDSANTAIIHLEDLGLIVDFNMFDGTLAQSATFAYTSTDCSGQIYALADNVLLPYMNFADKGVIVGLVASIQGAEEEEIRYIAKDAQLQHSSSWRNKDPR